MGAHRSALLVILFLLAIPVYLTTASRAWEERAEVRRSAEAGFVLPSRFSRVLALEHKGLLADFLLLRTITFYGERLEAERELSEADWQFVIASLDAVTDLDPHFLDPYLLAEGLLTWETGKFEEANRLLEKGMQHRTNDWQLPFYLGFNHFFFLQDSEKGAEYLMKASRLPESPQFLPSLAARLGYYGNQAKTAILFLKGILAQTPDPRIRASMEKRVQALELAALLEEKVERFYAEHGRPPERVEELVTRGYLDKLPEDPYGGDWVLLKSGRIYSNSRFVSKKAEK